MQNSDEISKHRAKKLFSSTDLASFKVGTCIDWAAINKNDYFEAMVRRHVKSTEPRELLRTALTDKINDREVFMKGIDQSYYYEEPDDYKG